MTGSYMEHHQEYNAIMSKHDPTQVIIHKKSSLPKRYKSKRHTEPNMKTSLSRHQITLTVTTRYGSRHSSIFTCE